jgi:hypothetical protein
MKTLMLTGLLFVLALPTFAFGPDTTLKVTDKGKIQVLLVKGRDQQYSRDWMGAMQTFKEVLEIDASNAMANLRVAECHYHLHKYELALQYIQKAGDKDPEVNKEYNFMLAQIHHRMGNLTEAIAAFNAFRPLVTEARRKEYMVDKHIADCEFARAEMADPQQAVVTNIGKAINTRFRDYCPVISPDGKSLYFTSRRNDTKGGGIAADFAYFEDIYVAEKDETSVWKQAVQVPGKVNSESHESVSSISEDGMELYLTVYNGDGKIMDLAYSKGSTEGDKWGGPKLFPKKTINTSFFESSVTLTGDGQTMYFVAERLNGKGRSDIYKSTRISKNEWTKPENVSILNTEDDENSVYVTPDGKYMFFSSNGHLGLGGYDIYMSVQESGQWSAPINLGYPINSVDDELHFKPTLDYQKAYLTSIRPDTEGLHDIYEVDLSGFDIRAFKR